ncbi:MAG: hypothetical protein HYV07_32480 [Deltaproteobacteria bacterium]|nr:hypothetical protein [Deltaproteobacteria bacterium]
MIKRVVCECLRTKNGYGEVSTPLGDWVDFRDGSSCYWCVRTMSTIGPDQKLVGFESCGRERSCFEGEDELVRA